MKCFRVHVLMARGEPSEVPERRVLGLALEPANHAIERLSLISACGCECRQRKTPARFVRNSSGVVEVVGATQKRVRKGAVVAVAQTPAFLEPREVAQLP